MLVNICMKFHEGILNGFWVTERTRPYRKIYYFQFQRAITPKIRNPELRFLRSARRLMLLYICVKFHENISNGFWVTERTRFCDRQTDGQTGRRPGQKQYVSQPYGGDITIWPVRPAKTQISLGIRPVWLESSLSAWRILGSLTTHWAHSEGDPSEDWSDWVDWVDTHADRRLRWAHISFCFLST